LSQTLGMRWQKMLNVCEYRQWKVTCPSTAGEDNYEYQLEFSAEIFSWNLQLEFTAGRYENNRVITSQ